MSLKYPKPDPKATFYPDESFDFITSNQVMEHVKDHDFFFQEIHRCLRRGGCSINLFPLREVLWEGHALMPIVDRLKNVTNRARLIHFFAKLGFTRHYYREMGRRGWKSLEEFAQVFAQVLETDTNYITAGQLLATTHRAKLDISFTYTKDLYIAKTKSFRGKRSYLYSDTGVGENIAFFLCKRISSVTALLKRTA